MRKNVSVGNPVVSLDNSSVFVYRARREQIAKKAVCHLYFFWSYEVFMGHSSSHEFYKPQ